MRRLAIGAVIRWRAVWRANEGVAAIEFALLATLFLIILAGTVNLGLLLYTASQLDAAVSAGAQYAENNHANLSGLQSTITTLVDNVNGTNWASSTVNVNNNDFTTTDCYCPTGTPTKNWSWGSKYTCGSVCANGGVAGQFVTIIATPTESFSAFLPTFGIVKSGSLTRSAVVETQ
jgi:Flp pilus assembly protein TadG